MSSITWNPATAKIENKVEDKVEEDE